MDRIARRVKMVQDLPEEPITWVCYNKEMIPYYVQLIKEVRGEQYFNKYVTVVADGRPDILTNTYFDDTLYELKGNGYD